VDVSGQVEAPPGPRLGGVVGDVGVVGDERPAGEVLEDSVLVVVEHRDVDVAMLARRPAEPRVHGPPAAEEPDRIEPVQQIADVRDIRRHRRARGDVVDHPRSLPCGNRRAQPDSRLSG
jgi:hypothetical protein